MAKQQALFNFVVVIALLVLAVWYCIPRSATPSEQWEQIQREQIQIPLEQREQIPLVIDPPEAEKAIQMKKYSLEVEEAIREKYDELKREDNDSQRTN